MQDKQYRALLERLIQREELVYGNSAGPEVDLDDVSSCLSQNPCRASCLHLFRE